MVDEKKWQKFWEERGINKAVDFSEKKKFYHLVMFPYSSGDLHIGHWYNFAPADIYARKKLMEGYNVLNPIGFDAFGLPAENAAINKKIDPETWTYNNIDRMRKQLKTMGNIYDWSREVITSDPEYYKWTQWLFLQLYKKGLAYRKKAPANWCPKDQTVLANEQVVDGCCERCGTKVVQKLIDQWLFKITNYAERLLEDLEKLDWPEKTKTMQRNWIGRSTGQLIEFKIKNSKLKIEIFTTRPDTIKGVTYMVLAPEHELVKKIVIQERQKLVEEYVKRALSKSERERQTYDKSGVFTGGYAVNPITNVKIPVWVADYVLTSYGTGAIMAVPAHDKRDADFVKTHKLPMGTDELIDPKGLGKTMVQYRLRDWLVSRQRYWGTPIPIVYCKKCGTQPVPEDQLPVELPKIRDYVPRGKPPLATAADWVKTTCPNCDGPSVREVETMDTFVDSSWYFLRYVDSYNKKEFASAKKVEYWSPVDIYIGGAEHSVLHLLYARFFTKVLYDLKLIQFDEPFPKLRHQGTILGSDHHKMSKSRGNVIDPDSIVAKFGSDSVRMYLAFMGPYDQGGPWNDDGLQGVVRYLNRVNGTTATKSTESIKKLVARTIKKVTQDIDELHFNTAISALMILQNSIDKLGIGREELKSYLKLLAPFAPHIVEELWHINGHTNSVFESQWPMLDEKLLKLETVTIPVQINGKTKGTIIIDPALRQEKVEIKAKVFVKGDIKKIIYVPSRVINFVLK